MAVVFSSFFVRGEYCCFSGTLFSHLTLAKYGRTRSPLCLGKADRIIHGVLVARETRKNIAVNGVCALRWPGAVPREILAEPDGTRKVVTVANCVVFVFDGGLGVTSVEYGPVSAILVIDCCVARGSGGVAVAAVAWRAPSQPVLAKRLHFSPRLGVPGIVRWRAVVHWNASTLLSERHGNRIDRVSRRRAAVERWKARDKN